ncbi:SAGA-associated factor [Salvia divinorum]|uniref:SAGA-associated factor n=1 Tax=Salvia divinorum TaxID=28513 RepID=A0ABD1G7T5_SALDI
MSVPKEDGMPFPSELLSDVFDELLDCIIVDVASESHRIARLGLDRHLDDEEEELRLSAEARARASDPSHIGEANADLLWLEDLLLTWKSAWERVERRVSSQQGARQLHRTGHEYSNGASEEP